MQNLLGQIVCCDTSEALEAYPQSATKDLLRHYPYRLARLRTPVLYIGMEARKQQLKAAWEEFSALRGQLTECTAQAQSLRDILEQCRRVLHSSVLEDLRKNWGSVQRHQASWQALEQARQEYEMWKENPILQAKITAEHLCQEEWTRQDQKRVEIEATLRSHTNKVQEKQGMQEQASREAEDARAGWLAFCQQEPLLQTEVEKKYQDAARSRPPDKIPNELSKSGG